METQHPKWFRDRTLAEDSAPLLQTEVRIESISDLPLTCCFPAKRWRGACLRGGARRLHQPLFSGRRHSLES